MTAEKGMLDILQLLTVLKELKCGYFCWPSKPNDQCKDFQCVIYMHKPLPDHNIQ